MPPVSFTDHVYEEGKENLGGHLGAVFGLPLSAADISGLTCTDGATLTGAFALLGTQTAFKIDVSEDSIDLTDPQSGDANGERITQQLQFFVAGQNQGALKRKLMTVPMIWFVKDAELKWNVVGISALQTASETWTVNKDIEARVTTTESTWGRRADGRKGVLYTVTYITAHGPLKHDGALPLTVV